MQAKSKRPVGAGALALAGLLLAAGAAHGDFPGALSEYRAGHYESAHAQFLALAELGDCASQFNLGAMALKGQGEPKDPGSGVGWLQAAAGNGCEQLVGNALPGLEARLSSEESRTAAGIVAQYGHAALEAQGVFKPQFLCPGETAPTVLESPLPEYPHTGAGTLQSAIVVVKLTVGRDGLARDPQVLLAVPAEGFAAAAVEAWLNSRFAPATRGSSAVESRLQARSMFAGSEAATPADLPQIRKARAAAAAGDPAAGYLVGLSGMLDASLGIPRAQAEKLLIDAARGGDSQAQYWIGSQLRDSAACHPKADGAVWLRHAAVGGSSAARLLLATDLLAEAPTAAQVGQARELLRQAAQSPEYFVTKHVAALLAASPVVAVRDPATALALARRLLAGEIQSDPQMFEVIAAAFAASGDFRGAVAQQQTAIRRARALGWDVRAMDDRLAAYRASRSWSGDLLARAPAATHAA
ncbi:MAG: energy transducer TonB [Gammaproteobacteria bacterium]|nr:energy transducer TonB [Gammaproteobacteria bacterium]